MVYFDIVGTYGTMNGAVEVELATPHPGAEAGRLDRGQIHLLRRIRCSANAATNLRNGLDAAWKMLERAARRRLQRGS